MRHRRHSRSASYSSEQSRSKRTRSSHNRVKTRHRNHSPAIEPKFWFASEYHPMQMGSIDGTDSKPHDKALVRAENSHFDALNDPKIRGNPLKTLFVGRLNFETTENSIRKFFEQFGSIEHIRLVRDIVTAHSKGYAFVEFRHSRDFENAFNYAHRQKVDGCVILVDYERSRVMPGWKPRRLGGGLGGKKESGQLRFGGRDRPFKPPRYHVP